MGGHFLIKNLAYLSYEEVNNFLKKNNIKTFSAQLNGEELLSKDIDSKWALLLGSEAQDAWVNAIMGEQAARSARSRRKAIEDFHCVCGW